ncbi:MAG: hypothetical protein JNJ88_09560 [Planctomycetes bacterium]|nr:hypothetical protein [Planctomycetota bacterium]
MIALASKALLGTVRAACLWRIWGLLLLSQLAIALPVVLPAGRAFREASNHRIESPHFSLATDFAAWSDLLPRLALLEPVLAAVAFAAFALGIASSAGWAALAARGDLRPTAAAFCSAAGEYFFRFLRLAMISLIAIAALRWLLYGSPSEALLRAWCGSEELTELSSEPVARAFVRSRSTLFVVGTAAAVLASDLGRLHLIRAGSHSALAAIAVGVRRLMRSPLRCGTAAAAAFALEIALLYVISFWVSAASSGDATQLNVASLFVATLAVGVIRETTRAGRFAALAAVSEDGR